MYASCCAVMRIPCFIFSPLKKTHCCCWLIQTLQHHILLSALHTARNKYSFECVYWDTYLSSSSSSSSPSPTTREIGIDDRCPQIFPLSFFHPRSDTFYNQYVRPTTIFILIFLLVVAGLFFFFLSFFLLSLERNYIQFKMPRLDGVCVYTCTCSTCQLTASCCTNFKTSSPFPSPHHSRLKLYNWFCASRVAAAAAAVI